MANKTFESDGRRILDATVNGRLTVFPKVNYREHFKSPYCPAALASKLARADIPTPLQQAQELVDSGNLSNAAALLEQAIAAQPQDGSLHFARGLLHERCGEPARAIEFFEEALRLTPENTTFLKFLARRYHETCGKSVEALGLLRQSFEKDSDDPSIHQLIGEILHTLGRVEEATILGKRPSGSFARAAASVSRWTQPVSCGFTIRRLRRLYNDGSGKRCGK